MYIIQRVIPHYRVALFRELYARTGAKVITAERPPGGTFLNYADPREHEWAETGPFVFPDPENAFRAEVPLDHILETWRPQSLVAEFGLRLSSTRGLVRARGEGRLQSFAFWTHGWQMERGFTAPQDIAVQALRVRALARADALGAYSEEGAAWLRQRMKAPVVTLGNALDPAEMDAAARTARPTRHGAPQLLAIGRLTDDKRFDDLIQMLRLLRREHPGAALTVIGDGPERGRLENLAKGDLGEAVRFTGALHAEGELAPHFLGADFVVVPGAAGLAVNHALAYRTPVVAFARLPSGPRHHPEIEYVVEGQSGLLVREPGVEPMAARLSRAIADGEPAALRQTLAESSPAPSIAGVVSRFEALFAILEQAPDSRRRRGAARRDHNPRSRTPVAFLWDNFGPMHNDRCQAVAERLGGPDTVLGVELFGKSDTYAWRSEPADGFRKVTLFGADVARPPAGRVAVEIVRACRRAGVRHAFFCHYERPEVFAAAVALRALGVRMFVMNDSKFDDYPRHIWWELAKRIGHMPYEGGLAAGTRAADYMRFLGHDPERIQLGYDGISVERVRRLAEGVKEPAFEERDFLIVARLVPKKNIAAAIEAFRIFTQGDPRGRKLRICGSGLLEAELKAQAAAIGLGDKIVFHGFEQIEVVAARMKSALALLLLSSEEQFGLVISEAQALGVPVIISNNCGATDCIVRNGVNGFVVESSNAEGAAFFMQLLSIDENRWKKMSAHATGLGAPLANLDSFVRGIDAFVGDSSERGQSRSCRR